MTLFPLKSRVRMRYGDATVIEIYPDAKGKERLYGVIADIGGYWLCLESEMSLLPTEVKSNRD